MPRRKYSLKGIKRTQPGDPITEEWTVRRAVINGVERDVLLRKIDGVKQRRLVDDFRHSSGISFSKAKEFNESRKPKARKLDNNALHKNVKEKPDKAWMRNPGKSDVVGIDTPKNRRKRKK